MSKERLKSLLLSISSQAHVIWDKQLPMDGLDADEEGVQPTLA